MSFHSRQDAYRWSEDQRPLGPCGLVIASGGFSHRYLLDRDGGCLSLFYIGMDNSDPSSQPPTAAQRARFTVH